MKNFIENLLKYKIGVAIMTVALLVLSLIAIPRVEINSDIYSYLPDGVESMDTAEILSEEYNDPGTFQILFRDTDLASVESWLPEFEALEYDGVSFVSSIDLVEAIDYDGNDVDDAFLYNLVVIDEVDWNSDEILEVVDIIKNVYEEQDITGGVVSGTIVIPFEVENMILLSAIIVVIMVILMVLFTPSYLEPALILASIGIAVLLNMGSNIIMAKGVSNVTFSVASLIQLAVSIDYSLILLGAYKKQRELSSDVDDAISSAVASSLKPILTGSVTTIAGFTALAAMQFEIGRDLGLVLAKGIVLSLLVTLLVLPVLIRLTHRLHEKLEHKDLMPEFGSIGKFVSPKVSAVLVVILFTFGILGGLAKGNMDYIYGEPPMESNSLFIQENFVEDNIVVIVFDDETDTSAKADFIAGLSDIDGLVEGTYYIDNDLAYAGAYALAGTELSTLITACDMGVLTTECAVLPDEILQAVGSGYITADEAAQQIIAAQVSAEFISENTERLMVYLDDPENDYENSEIFDTIAALRELAETSFGENYIGITGESAVLYDMMLITEEDNLIVQVLSILSIALILLIMFKSLSIPVILILTIQSAILINVGMSFITGIPLSFMGVVIISSVQLGATIDYTVLLTEKYEHARIHNGLDKKDGVQYAVSHSSHTLLTSGLSLTAAGFILTLFYVGTTAELGLLLGRGAFISLLVSLFIMPHILYIFDRFIIKDKA